MILHSSVFLCVEVRRVVRSCVNPEPLFKDFQFVQVMLMLMFMAANIQYFGSHHERTCEHCSNVWPQKTCALLHSVLELVHVSIKTVWTNLLLRLDDQSTLSSWSGPEASYSYSMDVSRVSARVYRQADGEPKMKLLRFMEEQSRGSWV